MFLFGSFSFQVHERHATTVTSALSGSQDAAHQSNNVNSKSALDDQLQSLESRRMLIEAHASIPTVAFQHFQ